MSMPFAYAVTTGLRKLSRHKVRTFFGIVPTTLLLVFIVLFSSLTASIDYFIRHKVLDQIESREEIIHLQKSFSFGSGNKETYAASEIAKAKQVAHVRDAQPERQLNSVIGKTSDLVPGIQLSVGNFTLTPPDTSKIYGAADFRYVPGQPIPIILNRTVFNREYLDMGGQTKISNTLDSPFGRPANQPVKTEFLASAYNKDQLQSRVFTATLGGLPALPQVSHRIASNSNASTETYEQLSTEEQAKLRQAQQDALSPYWNADKLRGGASFRFKIVGFNEELDSQNSLIPTDAGVALIQSLYDLQRSARTLAALPSAKNGAVFSGLQLDTTGKLVSDSLAPEPSSAVPLLEKSDSSQPSSLEPQPSSVIPVPGWIYAKNGEMAITDVRDLKVSADTLGINGMTISLDDPSNRAKAEESLAQAGFPEANNGSGITDIVRKVRGGLATALLWIVGVLALINSLILISVVGRSISDAQKEIGVYRALGARRRDIAKLYIIFSAIQTAIGVLLGVFLGLILLVPLAHFLLGRLTRFAAGTGLLDMSGPLGGFNIKLDASDFSHVDGLSILLYGVGLILLTVLVSLIPAWRAARISPVEAIRQAD